ncbi:SDR family oxidoreductase [Streptomyces sp. NPDC048428]|uniref:SDR family oxidoreductase n=1 Tax=Streptomyces sp. NPDC048428 TaxID=3154503 RepID=UPI003432EE72
MRVFMTGASGWIGSAVVPELIDAGHQVVGLARSDGSAEALTAAGAEVLHGDLDDLGALRDAAAAADGVIHLAFKHDIAFSGDFQGAAGADRRAVEAFGEALAGSGKPFVIASGTLGLAPGRVVTERDGQSPDWPVPFEAARARLATALLTVSLASRNVRSSVVRFPPTVHGEGDHGFMAALVSIARAKGVSGYIGDGANRWPAVHRADAAHLVRLALEAAPAGSTLHAVGEEGVPIRDVADAIGRRLGLPVASVSPKDADAHFGWLGGLVGVNGPSSSALTRESYGWQPTNPGLIEDLDKGHYFDTPTA